MYFMLPPGPRDLARPPHIEMSLYRILDFAEVRDMYSSGAIIPSGYD